MRHTADRTARELAQIADRATPSSNAWASIQSRIDAQASEPDSEVIMLEVENDEKERPNRNVLGFAAAAAVVLIVGLGIFVSLDDDGGTDLVSAEAPNSEDEAANAKAAVSPVPTTLDQAQSSGSASGEVTVEEAETVTENFFDALNSLDPDAAMALLSADVVISDDLVGEVSSVEYSNILTWNAAQGTTYAPQVCRYLEGIQPLTVLAVCETSVVNAENQALGRGGIPVTVAITIGAGGIEELSGDYGAPTFSYLGDPFERWVAANHPGDEANLVWGDTQEEALVNGLMLAEYAAEWAEFLDANDCEFNEGCGE
jgi:hypothetical protein